MTVNIILVSEKHVICSGEFFNIFFISKEIVWNSINIGENTECDPFCMTHIDYHMIIKSLSDSLSQTKFLERFLSR